MSDRRTQIADAGIHVLATRGAHALTHLGIDRELGLAQGSTSYYARTRHDLISLVVEKLAERTGVDLAAQAIPDDITPEAVAAMVVQGLDATMQRAEDHRARLLLLLECHSDPELQTELATRPDVRAASNSFAGELLARLGIAHPEINAPDFVALIDSLLMQRIIRTAPINENSVIAAYLKGLTSGS